VVQKQEAVDYHNVVAFAKQAELIDQYCKKGNQIYVEGRLTTRSWDDQTTGKKAYRTEVILENFQFGNKGTARTVGTSSSSRRCEV
jgi:single-strand DNA-binding protein